MDNAEMPEPGGNYPVSKVTLRHELAFDAGQELGSSDTELR